MMITNKEPNMELILNEREARIWMQLTERHTPDELAWFAFNGKTANEMRDDLQQLRSENETLKQQLAAVTSERDELARQYMNMRNDLKALRDANTELTKQLEAGAEPVGYVSPAFAKGDYMMGNISRDKGDPQLSHPLYLAPPKVLVNDCLCETCGIGMILPSGKCDHCNILSQPEPIPQELAKPDLPMILQQGGECWEVFQGDWSIDESVTDYLAFGCVKKRSHPGERLNQETWYRRRITLPKVLYSGHVQNIHLTNGFGHPLIVVNPDGDGTPVAIVEREVQQ